ncbi:DUF551 domain-containing protein [Photorhabdus sp. P32]|uniref:DUF551 domain-containing protein n=1 Tax=Photorhabdus sp. P32 TaxID=3117549 RepID=UPI00311B06E9
MNWIKCSERLPELVDDSVLVWFSDIESMDMVHIEDYFKDKWYIIRKVTHWMPLPNPPEEL